MWTVLGLIAVTLVGYFWDRLDHRMIAIVNALESMQGDVESMRSEVQTISSDVNVLRRRLAPEPDRPSWDDLPVDPA